MEQEEILSLLLYLIRDEMSISQIASILNLSYLDIYKYVNCLREKGFEIECKYYSNGNMKYYINNSLYSDTGSRIITSNEENNISLLVYSDLHLGSCYESYELLEKIFEYGKDRDIHIHLNLGDLIEGNVRPSNIKVPWYNQINIALEKYPHLDDTLVFVLLGNHDQSLLRDYGLNISKIISQRRGDLIPIGYGSNIIEIKNDFIALQHTLLKQSEVPMGAYSYSIILRGHHHMTSVLMDSSNLTIYLPALSNLNFNKSHFPGALHLRLRMRSGYIEYVDFDELTYFNNNFYVTNTTNIYVGRGKVFRESTERKNEEEIPKVLRR